ncbi:hypothetical protein FCV25MIE_26058 [Fagus crenata]
MIASNSVVNQVGPLPLNPPPIMPIADSNQNLPYHQSELHLAYAPFAPQQGVTREVNGCRQIQDQVEAALEKEKKRESVASGLGIAVPLASKAEEELSDGAGSVLGVSKTKLGTVGAEASAIGNAGPESAKGDRAEPCVFCSGETPDSGVLGTDEDSVLGADKGWS